MLSLTRIAVVAALSAAILTPSVSNSQDVPVMVPAQWLADHVREPNLVVITVGQTRARYDSAHIDGSRFLPYSAYTRRENGLTSEIAPPAALDSALESVGVSTGSRIVIDGPAIITHRLFLTLDVNGFRGRVGILNADLDAWRRLGGAVASTEPVVQRGNLTLAPVTDAVVDRAWVRSHLNDAAIAFADGRMKAAYDRGHIPGAVSATFFNFIAPDAPRGASTLPPADSLRARLAAYGVSESRSIVAYCAIGETASGLYFIARALGRPVRLYDGSWEDWTADTTSPVEKQ
jgi:thiosulfate/3-mercaptopyruvate sulfurtransferase